MPGWVGKERKSDKNEIAKIPYVLPVQYQCRRCLCFASHTCHWHSLSSVLLQNSDCISFTYFRDCPAKSRPVRHRYCLCFARTPDCVNLLAILTPLLFAFCISQTLSVAPVQRRAFRTVVVAGPDQDSASFLLNYANFDFRILHSSMRPQVTLQHSKDRCGCEAWQSCLAFLAQFRTILSEGF